MLVNMAARVLNQVRRRILTIERALNQGSAGHRELQMISLVIANLYRVEHHFRPETFRELIESLNELKSCIDSHEPASLSYQAPRSRTGSYVFKRKNELYVFVADSISIITAVFCNKYLK